MNMNEKKSIKHNVKVQENVFKTHNKNHLISWQIARFISFSLAFKENTRKKTTQKSCNHRRHSFFLQHVNKSCHKLWSNSVAARCVQSNHIIITYIFNNFRWFPKNYMRIILFFFASYFCCTGFFFFFYYFGNGK